MIFFEGLYSQKIKTLKKLSKLNARKIKSLMEEEIPSGTNQHLAARLFTALRLYIYKKKKNLMENIERS